MPALRANGWTVPVAVEGATRPPPEAVGGGRGFMQDGALREGSGSWRGGLGVSSGWLTPLDAEALRGWMLRNDDVWPLNASAVASRRGADPLAGGLYTFRPGEGRFFAGGVAVERGSTNEWRHSADLTNAVWTKVNGTVTANAAIAPDGTTSGDLFLPSATSTTDHRFTQSLPALTDNTLQSVSFYARAGGYNWVAVGTTTKAGTFQSSFFDLLNGVKGSQNANHTATILPAVGGFHRITLVWNSGAGATTPAVNIYASATGSFSAYGGDGTSGVYLWGMQFEKDFGAATSYIPTGAATAARNPGVLRVPTTLTAAEGTIAFWFTPQQVAAEIVNEGTSPMLGGVAAYGVPGSWRLWAYRNASTPGAEPQLLLVVVDSAGVQTTHLVRSGGSGWYTPGVTRHYAVAWQTGKTFSVYVDGVAYGPFVIANTLSSAPPYLAVGEPALPGYVAGNGVFSEVFVAPYAVTAGQAGALAARTAILPSPPLLECDGDLMRGRTANMTAEVQDSSLWQGSQAVGVREQVTLSLRDA